MCGIFAYLNFLTPKSRKEILDCLLDGLQRLEYRGYDSAGLGIDRTVNNEVLLFKREGKVGGLKCALFDYISDKESEIKYDDILNCHVGNLSISLCLHFNLYRKAFLHVIS